MRVSEQTFANVTALPGDIKTGTKKTLWLYPEAPETASEDARYFLKFKLSDLDKTTKENIQYEPGDNLTFKMTVYYLTGAGGIEASDIIDGNKNYALKAVNYISSAGTARYRYTSNGTVLSSDVGAGRSFFHVKALWRPQEPFRGHSSSRSHRKDLTASAMKEH